jgi:ATP-dependent Clp protease, protease subunit
MIEDNQIDTNSGNDSKLSRYSSNNFKKSLDLAKKISNHNLSLNDNCADSSGAMILDRSEKDKLIFELVRDRIIFLDGRIDSNQIAVQLVLLDALDPEKDIYLYINSTGGSVSDGMGILAMMKRIRPDVCTICTGVALGLGAILLSAGTRGKRMSLHRSQIMIGQPFSRNKHEQITDIQSKEILYIKSELNDMLAHNTGQTLQKIKEDTDRIFYMSAEEAKEYGLIDTVIDSETIQINDTAKKQIKKIHDTIVL